jgi:hypothetical protein
MIMVHVDELPVLKRLVAHAAVMLLRSQQAVELLLGQAVARDPVLHGLGGLARASVARSTGTCRLLPPNPLAAPLLPHSGKVDLRLLGFALRHARSIFEIVYTAGLEPKNLLDIDHRAEIYRPHS